MAIGRIRGLGGSGLLLPQTWCGEKVCSPPRGVSAPGVPGGPRPWGLATGLRRKPLDWLRCFQGCPHPDSCPRSLQAAWIQTMLQAHPGSSSAPAHTPRALCRAPRLQRDPQSCCLVSGWPGRFDRRIIVDKPDLKGRIAILKVHARDVRSEERRVGKECLRLCRSRWSPYH